jgi:hypothetical protein
MVGIRSPDGLVVGLAPATLEFWRQFPNERNQPRPGWAPDPLMVGIKFPDGAAPEYASGIGLYSRHRDRRYWTGTGIGIIRDLALKK